MQTATVEAPTLAPITLEPPPAQPLQTVATPAANEPRTTALSVVDYAVRSGATVQQIQALMDLQVQADNHRLALMQAQRQMEREDKAEAARRAFDDALSKFKALNIVVPKTKKVQQRAKSGGPGPTYMQSEFSVVADLLQPALSSCGFSYKFDPVFERSGKKIEWVRVTCELRHVAGHTETVTLEGPPDDSGSKNPLQEGQSTVTFLMRHTLLAITGTAQAGEDNDGRGTRGMREDGEALPEAHSGEADNALQALIETGQAKAKQGMQPLTAWWSALDKQQQALVTPSFAAMRQSARLADANKGDGHE